MLTNYILGDYNSHVVKTDLDENSFRPSFQHVFKENYPPTYVKIMCSIDGEVRYRLFDLSTQQFVDDIDLDTKNALILDIQESFD